MTGVLGHVDVSGPGDQVQTEIDEALVCRQIRADTHDVTSFVLTSSRGRRFAFRAGQYVTVAATIDGRRVERCYTISSPSTCDDELTITVKRVPDGPMSNWLHDRFAVGDHIAVTGPFGQFVTGPTASKLLFLSAGSGITPVMSMSRTLCRQSSPDIVFVHSARSPRDIVFRAELDDLAKSQPGLRVAAICEQDAPGERWAGARGRLTMSLLGSLAPDLHGREIFLCGPPPYLRAVRDLLEQAGVDPTRCHVERFTTGTTDTAGPGPTPEAGPIAPGFAVEFRRSGRRVDILAGESVLQAGLRSGVALPSSCGEGLCGTCKTTLLSGRVDMQHNGGIRAREIGQGSVLLCCSTPLDDLVVDA